MKNSQISISKLLSCILIVNSFDTILTFSYSFTISILKHKNRVVTSFSSWFSYRFDDLLNETMGKGEGNGEGWGAGEGYGEGSGGQWRSGLFDSCGITPKCKDQFAKYNS